MKKNPFLFYSQLAVTLLATAFLVVPLIQSVIAGFTNNYFIGIKSGLTLRWIGEVLSLYNDTIVRSLFIGLSCLVLALVIGVPAAYVMAKLDNRLTRFIEELLVVPLAIPGLAIALGILLTYGQWTAFRKSWLIILVGHLIFTLPFMVRSVVAILSSFNLKELEESAASLGAGFAERFFQIVIPNAAYGILSGALMVFTLSIGEFNLTWMLHTPLTKTLPVGLADSYASMRLEIGAAYTFIFLVMIIPLLVAMQWAASAPEKILFLVSLIKKTTMKPFIPLAALIQEPGPQEDEKLVVEKGGTQIRISGCAKTFANGTRALLPVDLQIDGGQTVVILGPSGCGKTTLLRIIAGLEQPDGGGQIYFDNEDVTAVPIEKRNVGMVFQSYALFPNMTVGENIVYGLRLRGISAAKQEKRLKEMLSMMKIAALKDRSINQLSGGQRQRVALARAIAVRPRILLLDEPLTALDAKLRDELRVEIDQLLRSLGITAVYVTHDQAEAMALGDRIVVMEEGRVSQIGTPREIYFSPQNSFVAAFIGTINRIGASHLNGSLQLSNGTVAIARLPRVNLTENGGGKKERVSLFFRPEHAFLCEDGSGHFSCWVKNIVFIGDRLQILVTTQDKEEIYVDAPGKTEVKFGQKVEIGLDLEQVFTMTGGQ